VNSRVKKIKEIEILPAYLFLFDKARYKICWGGRGAGRSWNFARALIIRALEKKTLILCVREIQRSIKDSIYKLICNQIEMLGLSEYFTILRDKIVCCNGSEFFFEGLFANVDKIKSFEGIDICDVEEAASVSEASWQVLIPTIRKVGSEIWIKFNPQFEDDPAYKRWVLNPPENSIVRFTTYKDNKYFSEELKKEMEWDFKVRPDVAKNIWNGEPLGAGIKFYSNFDINRHVKEIDIQELLKDKDIKNDIKFYMAIDPAQHYYPACLWCCFFPRNKRKKFPEDYIKYIYNEFPKIDYFNMPFHEVRKKIYYTGTLKELSELIKQNDKYNIYKRGMDTRYAKGTGSYNITDTFGLVEQFKKHYNGGLYFTLPATRHIDMAHKEITDDLQNDNLIISTVCRNMIITMQSHRFIEGTEKESEKYKDFSDCLRILYAVINDPIGVESRNVEYVNKFSFALNTVDAWQI